METTESNRFVGAKYDAMQMANAIGRSSAREVVVRDVLSMQRMLRWEVKPLALSTEEAVKRARVTVTYIKVG